MSEDRFEFGRNWRNFLATVDEAQIAAAQCSLKDYLELDSLEGLRFLDIGCGSGLFSLAAHRMGASVHAFDLDPESIAAAQELKQRFAPDSQTWKIEKGDVLDIEWVEQLGCFDVVYAWGVLHHTGNMAAAFNAVSGRVLSGGKLFIAIYNHQGIWSRIWGFVKRTYVRSPPYLRPVIVSLVWIAMEGKSMVSRIGSALLGIVRPGRGTASRGMSYWHDLVDWCGGYPFEVATPEQVFSLFRSRGFVLDRLKTCGGGLGCNEFVFTNGSERRSPPEIRSETKPSLA